MTKAIESTQAIVPKKRDAKAKKTRLREMLARKRGASAPAGTRLLKYWGGETHEVVVTTDGALWNGHAYGSLSAVARAMTGTRRNGPRFFGLREERTP
ncbi:MAG: DUF2924 domain-containing protein [Pseudomonadota bacterium]